MGFSNTQQVEFFKVGVVGLSPHADGQGTVSDTALDVVGFGDITGADVDDAREMFVQCVSGTIRWRVSGADPTTSTYHTLTDTDGVIRIYGNQAIRNWRMIRSGDSDATVVITLWELPS